MKWLLLALVWGAVAPQSPVPSSSESDFSVPIDAVLDAPAEAVAVDRKLYEYVPSEAVSLSVRTEVAHWLEQSLVAPPETKATLREHLMETDLIALLGEEIRKQGYPVDSVASAVTLWFVVNYGIIHDTEVSDEAARALYGQITALFATLPDFERGTDAQKQRMAEGLYWAAALQRHAYEEAKAGMPGYDLAAIADESRRIMQGYGLDFDAVELTDKGVVRREAADRGTAGK